jgi:NAD(P)-dependent dehydrogenase (short-subunit alcohol dehydrogenase family)
MKRLVVIGATGDVGAGIIDEALARRWVVLAVARDADRLAALAARHRDPLLSTMAGSVASEQDAITLVRAISLDPGDSVVVSVNVAWDPKPIAETSAADLSRMFEANLIPHLVAAAAFLPLLSGDSVYVGIGGGMADWVPRHRALVSMAQAAQRNLYRSLVGEGTADGPAVREVLIASMVNGRSNRVAARPEWVTDRDVGAVVCQVVQDPDSYPGPVIKIPHADPRSHRSPGPSKPTAAPIRATGT